MPHTSPAAHGTLRALVLIDGLDEGGDQRGKIEEHVFGVLASQGHMMLVTSRPAGLEERMKEEDFKKFNKLGLNPITEQLQRDAIHGRLCHKTRTEELMQYVRNKAPIDTETGERVTGNPLMLSIIISLFEIESHSVKRMPRINVGLYSRASEAMLKQSVKKDRCSATQRTRPSGWRTVVTSARHLLLCARARKAMLTKNDLEAAVRFTRIEDLLNDIKSDKMPQISTLQSEPLEVQIDAHLSCACLLRLSGRCPSDDPCLPLLLIHSPRVLHAVKAFCKGSQLPESAPPPWQWNAWWGQLSADGHRDWKRFCA